MRLFISFFLCFISIQSLKADVLVLVHGYMSGAKTWETSGVTSILQANGWGRAGILLPQSNQSFASLYPATKNKTYLVDLPSLAPIKYQADLLKKAVAAIEQANPKENLILVGHSAGGVVCRAMLVRYGQGKIVKLITIAAPHSGTHRALDALNFTHSGGPVGMFKSFFGGSKYHAVRSSTPLLIDLAPPATGNLLSWLNFQPHPNIEYISVIRADAFGFSHDTIVPVASQDMNNVPALAGQSAVVKVATGHELSIQDGYGLVQLLKMKKPEKIHKIEIKVKEKPKKILDHASLKK